MEAIPGFAVVARTVPHHHAAACGALNGIGTHHHAAHVVREVVARDVGVGHAVPAAAGMCGVGIHQATVDAEAPGGRVLRGMHCRGASRGGLGLGRGGRALRLVVQVGEEVHTQALANGATGLLLARLACVEQWEEGRVI